jgi:DMSO/TMAO reductase YedYZ molybdopterin-dependent catalytic subunit
MSHSLSRRRFLFDTAALAAAAVAVKAADATAAEAKPADMPKIQCFYRPETYTKEDRDLAIATIQRITKPVIAYKILAAGRIAPAEGFEVALKSIAKKDGICIGIFPKDKPGMLAEDVALACKG